MPKHVNFILFVSLLLNHVTWWSNATETLLPTREKSPQLLICSQHKNDSRSFFINQRTTPISSLLLRSGDIQSHPGPNDRNSRERPRCGSTVKDTGRKTRQPKFPCVSCGKGVTAKSKAVSCDDCDKWTHSRCAGIPDSVYQSLASNETNFNYKCDICCYASLPFHYSTAEPESADAMITPRGSSSVNSSEIVGKKGLHLIHINVRSLVPKLSELRHLLGETKAAVLAISESWLDETIGDNEIHIDGYSVLRRD